MSRTQQTWVLNDQNKQYRLGRKYDTASPEVNYAGIRQTMIKEHDLHNMIHNVFQPRDERNTYDIRKVILVGHQLDSDIRILTKAGFDWRQLPNIIGCTSGSFSSQSTIKVLIPNPDIDTTELSKDVLGFTTSPKLEKLLRYQQIDYVCLHTAAFDSHFTLSSMLDMARRWPQVKAGRLMNQQVMAQMCAMQIHQFEKHSVPVLDLYSAEFPPLSPPQSPKNDSDEPLRSPKQQRNFSAATQPRPLPTPIASPTASPNWARAPFDALARLALLKTQEGVIRTVSSRC